MVVGIVWAHTHTGTESKKVLATPAQRRQSESTCADHTQLNSRDPLCSCVCAMKTGGGAEHLRIASDMRGRPLLFHCFNVLNWIAWTGLRTPKGKRSRQCVRSKRSRSRNLFALRFDIDVVCVRSRSVGALARQMRVCHRGRRRSVLPHPVQCVCLFGDCVRSILFATAIINQVT